MDFKLHSEFKPTGDQPEAIKQLTDGLNSKEKFQTLLGVTGSGKTFTIANVVERTNKPTLVLAHNKTLAAQLYSEFKQFFAVGLADNYSSHVARMGSVVCSWASQQRVGQKASSFARF